MTFSAILLFISVTLLFLWRVLLLALFLLPLLLHSGNLFRTDGWFLGFWLWIRHARRKPTISEVDGARVKEVRSVDRREDVHGGFVAYVARLGGGSGLTT